MRTPVKEKAKQLVKLFKSEHPDYNYLREISDKLGRIRIFRLIPVQLKITQQVPNPKRKLQNIMKPCGNTEYATCG